MAPPPIRAEWIAAGEASALIDDPEFLNQWRVLFDECPWATPYQSPAFARVWYPTYATHFEPLFAIARGENGQLIGLMPFSRCRLAQPPLFKVGDVVAAGAHQSEYQTWICRPKDSGVVARALVDCFSRLRPRATLTLRYIPPGLPIEPLTTRAARRLCAYTSHRRPLLVFGDGSDIETSLAKSGNKSRLRQLRKLGDVTFEEITDQTEFATALAEAAAYHDARHLAVRGSAPFQNDPRKAPFYLALQATEPKLIHATALRVGGELASFHANMISRDEVQMGFIAHNPALERLSPGKLHILMLASLLREKGYRLLDLTPGDEAYKDRFANDFDQVHTLAIYSDPLRRAVGAALLHLKLIFKRMRRRTECSRQPRRLISHVGYAVLPLAQLVRAYALPNGVIAARRSSQEPEPLPRPD